MREPVDGDISDDFTVLIFRDQNCMAFIGIAEFKVMSETRFSGSRRFLINVGKPTNQPPSESAQLLSHRRRMPDEWPLDLLTCYPHL